jgi:hypothetical protein
MKKPRGEAVSAPLPVAKSLVASSWLNQPPIPRKERSPLVTLSS